MDVSNDFANAVAYWENIGIKYAKIDWSPCRHRTGRQAFIYEHNMAFLPFGICIVGSVDLSVYEFRMSIFQL